MRSCFFVCHLFEELFEEPAALFLVLGLLLGLRLGSGLATQPLQSLFGVLAALLGCPLVILPSLCHVLGEAAQAPLGKLTHLVKGPGMVMGSGLTIELHRLHPVLMDPVALLVAKSYVIKAPDVALVGGLGEQFKGLLGI